ncbi:Eco57I restriction-modification methylase domain-containing protein [Mesorhizobium carmichaelinearum]|uniref:Eco57I restriction-modification methylase domain-containing protein n=1 Tax=Mesorhizobium carmichaelinearum TaxID=1208188 RepID=UPI000BA31184|nr:Eco57I restriction-modification methylase domain-containing protein [Mesorhizobium carmichaelinearum]
MPDRDGTSIEQLTEVAQLHARTGVYTRSLQIQLVLDAVGWTAREDLERLVLVEPSAGDGGFLVEAAKRLVESLSSKGGRPTRDILRDRIRAWEFFPDAASAARGKLIEVLTEAGLTRRDAQSVVEAWVNTSDFLESDLPPMSADVVVGNPPYLRWSLLPAGKRAAYEAILPADVVRGDLLLPFLEKGIDALKIGGRLGFIVSDRWQHAAYASRWRTRMLPQIDILERVELAPKDTFDQPVDAYVERLVVKRRAATPSGKTSSTSARLFDSSFDIRVGPALGCTPAYVLHPDELHAVEHELLRPWVDGKEVSEEGIAWKGRHIITLYDEEGRLRDLGQFPRAMGRLEAYRDRLEQRAITIRGAKPWWRPIDRLSPEPWSRRKLLIPELSKIPRVAMDTSGAIPSHGVYAVFSEDDKALDSLYAILRDGGLAKALQGNAPKVKGGYVRCYEAILRRLRL